MCVHVYNYASKNIFKHWGICKIFPANMCPHYMWSLKFMPSFLIEKIDSRLNRK
jgi:hypothetical protein